MALNSKRLKEEIETVKNSIVILEETKIKCDSGILLNKIVLKAFEEELKHAL